jgi:outer membrane immunogenic protein
MKAIAVVALLAAAPSIAQAAEPAQWNGAYLGAMGGYANSDVQHTDVNGNFGGEGLVYETGGSSAAGFVGAGYDWQSGQFVLGAAADIGMMSANGEAFPSGPDEADEFYMTSKVKALASLRGRAGIALDRALIYVTAGVAAADMETLAFYIGSPSNAHDGWRNGWVAGGGLEYAINDQWSVGVEGLYYDLGTTQAYWPTFENVYLEKVKASVVVGRAGLNYRF